MDFNAKSIVLEAFRQLLGAIVRLALRNGVNYLEFSNITKSLYVDIAAKEYGIKGRDTNLSRISMMTGLERKEVKRIKGLKQANTINKSPDKIAKVINEWCKLSSNTDQQKPKTLEFIGEEKSFSQLVRQHGGGIAPVTMLRELKRSKMVEEMPSGKLKLLRKDYVPNYHSQSDKSPTFVNPDAIVHGSSMLVDHINTIFHNLYREDKKTLEQLDLRATHHSVKQSKVPDFYQYIAKSGMDFLTKADQWLMDNSTDDTNLTNEPCVRLGVGLYSIEGENKSIGMTK